MSGAARIGRTLGPVDLAAPAARVGGGSVPVGASAARLGGVELGAGRKRDVRPVSVPAARVEASPVKRTPRPVAVPPAARVEVVPVKRAPRPVAVPPAARVEAAPPVELVKGRKGDARPAAAERVHVRPHPAVAELAQFCVRVGEWTPERDAGRMIVPPGSLLGDCGASLRAWVGRRFGWKVRAPGGRAVVVPVEVEGCSTPAPLHPVRADKRSAHYQCGPHVRLRALDGSGRAWVEPLARVRDRLRPERPSCECSGAAAAVVGRARTAAELQGLLGLGPSALEVIAGRRESDAAEPDAAELMDDAGSFDVEDFARPAKPVDPCSARVVDAELRAPWDAIGDLPFRHRRGSSVCCRHHAASAQSLTALLDDVELSDAERVERARAVGVEVSSVAELRDAVIARKRACFAEHLHRVDQRKAESDRRKKLYKSERRKTRAQKASARGRSVVIG